MRSIWIRNLGISFMVRLDRGLFFLFQPLDLGITSTLLFSVSIQLYIQPFHLGITLSLLFIDIGAELSQLCFWRTRNDLYAVVVNERNHFDILAFRFIVE